MTKEPVAPPVKSGRKKLVFLLGGCGLLALAAGLVVPYFVLHAPAHGEHPHEDAGGGPSVRRAYVPFGDAIVNLNEDRLTRYLRVKVLLVVDAKNEKQVTELVAKNKPALKNWLIGHLSDKSLQEVSGISGNNKVRREIWHEFNKELFPDGSEKILDIFFEEFVVQ